MRRALSARIGNYLRQQHMGLLALFLVIAGGTALAVTAPKNSIKSKSVKNEALKTQDLKDGKAVAGADVIDDSLKGADVDEGSLNLPQVELPATLPPSGPAGGDLSGSYPDPQIAASAVGSDEVADDSINGADLQNATITGDDVAPDSLDGADIREASLGEVPSALTATLGGLGRSASFGGTCDPETSTFLNCGFMTVNLPAPSRLLLVGSIRATTEDDSDTGVGSCRLGTSVNGTLPAPDNRIVVDDGNSEYSTLTTITPSLGPGSVNVGIDCNQVAIGAIDYDEGHMSAVALSAD